MSASLARTEYCPQTVKPGWKTVALKRLFDVKLGKMLRREPSTPGDVSVPYLKANNVQWGVVAIDDLPEMWATPNEVREFSVQPGDLLVCEGRGRGTSSNPLRLPSTVHRSKRAPSRARDSPRGGQIPSLRAGMDRPR